MKGNKIILVLIFIYFIILSSQIYICYDRITGRSTSGSGQVSITILASCPEIYFPLGNMNVKVGDDVNFTVCAKYGNPPFYFTHNSTFMNFTALEGNCATVSFHAEGYLKGNHYVEFTVTDGRCTDSQVIIITIKEELPPGGGGGGGGGGLICIPDWNCTEWSKCSPQGIQLRTCSLMNDCPAYNKPVETRACIYTPITTPECTTRLDCPKNQTCIEGGCYRITCKTAKDCPDDMTCKDKLCSEWECSKDSECASDENCKEHLCMKEVVSAKPFFLQANICEIPAWLALLIIILFSIYAHTLHKHYDLLAENNSRKLRNIAVISAVSYIAFLVSCFITFFICPNWILYALLILFSVFFTTASIGFKKSDNKNWFAFWYFGILALLSIIFCTLVYLVLNGAKVISINPEIMFLILIQLLIVAIIFAVLYHRHKINNP